MGLRPTHGDKDPDVRHNGIKDLGRFFNGADAQLLIKFR